MQIGELAANMSSHLRDVANSGKPLLLTKHGRPHVTVVSHDWYERAVAALERETTDAVREASMT